jgi:predicted Ser/Thr protein kinase
MDSVEKALQNLDQSVGELEQRTPVSFEEFLNQLASEPAKHLRSVFQVFHDMVKSYIGEGVDEYPDDSESIGYLDYDCDRLFVEGSDHPFFADRIFANRLVNLVEALRSGAQQNKIYIFDGPPGCGKSTFLNNLLLKFEEYANTEEGLRYEVVWRLDRRVLGSYVDVEVTPLVDKLRRFLDHNGHGNIGSADEQDCAQPGEATGAFWPASTLGEDHILEIACPSHDNPLLLIPKPYREHFLDDLIENVEFKWILSSAKEYDWVFRDQPCTICASLYEALLSKLKSPGAVFRMLFARPYRVNRRLGEGITVFNPGDAPIRRICITNDMLQRRIDSLLGDSNRVRYAFSHYARTNSGIYALMDIKSHNTERIIELHNIISEGIHKVQDIEENVDSLFLAVMNPEDRKNVQGFQSFSDRIEYVHIPYVLDVRTEVAIYRNVFGRHIEENFLPMVLENFARVVIATRMNTKSEALLEWIGDPDKYSQYCDKNLQLLKMAIYAGVIPAWLMEEDRKAFTAKRRRQIIREAESEGDKGLSGRDAIRIFNELLSSYAKEDSLINMSTLCGFFHKQGKEVRDMIPEGLLESLLRMYDFSILQEVKESLYYYNEEQIARDIQNYLFALNFELGSTETCTFTGDRLEIEEDFLAGIELRLLGAEVEEEKRLAFRKDTQQVYTSRTLTQEIMLEGKAVTKTELYDALHERYVYNLKEKVLDPFLENENFRRAIKDYARENFRTYDRRIRSDVTFLMNNLVEKFRYTQKGAKEVCIYVIDNDLARKFQQPA